MGTAREAWLRSQGYRLPVDKQQSPSTVVDWHGNRSFSSFPLFPASVSLLSGSADKSGAATFVVNSICRLVIQTDLLGSLSRGQHPAGGLPTSVPSTSLAPVRRRTRSKKPTSKCRHTFM